jgi:hypothetical protein
MFHSFVDAKILHSSVGINVAADNVLFNLVTKDTQLMRGNIAWRRSREKDLLLLQLLIESTMQVGNISIALHPHVHSFL